MSKLIISESERNHINSLYGFILKEQEEKIYTDHDRTWDYKVVNGLWFTRRKANAPDGPWLDISSDAKYKSSIDKLNTKYPTAIADEAKSKVNVQSIPEVTASTQTKTGSTIDNVKGKEEGGEIEGENVMKGYYKNPEATSETMAGDWLKSGDLGRKDSDGFVYVTGRLKEIYVSSAGKNIAPLVIEETMKSMPLISQCMLVGDNRNYCTALFTLDVGAILRDKHGLDGATEVPKDPNEQIAKLEALGSKLSDYTESPEIHAEIDAQVQELNKKFMNPEQVKKFTILPRDLNVDEGELTPTLKIRRKQINDNWSKEINAMYN